MSVAYENNNAARTKIIKLGFELAKLEKPIGDDGFKERFELFFTLCFENSVIPTMELLSLAFGYRGHSWVHELVTGKSVCDSLSEYQLAILKKSVDIIKASITTGMLDGVIKTGQGVFYTTNVFPREFQDVKSIQHHVMIEPKLEAPKSNEELAANARANLPEAYIEVEYEEIPEIAEIPQDGKIERNLTNTNFEKKKYRNSNGAEIVKSDKRSKGIYKKKIADVPPIEEFEI